MSRRGAWLVGAALAALGASGLARPPAGPGIEAARAGTSTLRPATPGETASALLAAIARERPAGRPSARPGEGGRARYALLDSLATDLLAAARLPGLSVAVIDRGAVALARGYGFADLERRAPVTAATRFRCASVSKTITATAVALLVQEGRLDLDAPVRDYVPSWPAAPPITPRQLAGHLAGIAHYGPTDRIDRRRQYESVTEALGTFRDSPRAAVPGERYVYSTHGFTLLSAVVEGAAGRPFLEYLADDVFGPLGMARSGPDLRDDPPPGTATLYGRRGGEPFPISRPENPSYKWGGGGLLSTPTDLVRLAAAYMDGVLDAAVVAEMFTSQTTSDGEETGVGIAWRIGEDRLGRRIVHHSGAMGGARTTLVLYPDEALAIAVMTNVVWPSDIRRTAELLLDAYRVARDAAPPPAAAPGAGGAEAAGRPPSGWLPSSELGEGEARAYTGRFAGEPASGRLLLDRGTGWVTSPPPFTEWTGQLAVDRMRVRPLRGEVHVLVTPFGLMDFELWRTPQGIRGRLRASSERIWELIATAPTTGGG